MSVIRSLRNLIVGSTEALSTTVSIGQTAIESGKEAVDAWRADRAEQLLASAYARRLDLMQRVREDAKRAVQQGIDPAKVMSLTFQDCLEASVRDLQTAQKIKFEPLD